MKSKLFFITLIIFAVYTSFAQERPEPDHFAGRMTVIGVTGSLLVLEIPEELYQGLERPDLGDIRVFDTDGIPVPFVVRGSPTETINPPPEDVPFFIWNPANNQKAPNNRDIEIDITGAVVRITGVQETPAVPTYLVDLSSCAVSPISLEIDFDHNNNFFNSAAEIQTSSDLTNWQVFNNHQSVAYYGNNDINRSLLEIPKDIRYALIKFTQTTPQVKNIKAVFAPYTIPAKTKESIFSGIKNKDNKSVYYDTKGHYPVLSIDFRFNEPDSIFVQIKNQIDYPDGSVHFLKQERIYRINYADGARTSPPIEVRNTGRHWTLTAEGESLFANIPDCYVTWEQMELVFLARGKGPWTISYGNTAYGTANENALTLTDADTFLQAEILENVYTPRAGEKKPMEWSWILWGVMIIAAGLLTILAFFAAKSIGKN